MNEKSRTSIKILRYGSLHSSFKNVQANFDQYYACDIKRDILVQKIEIQMIYFSPLFDYYDR